MELGPHCVTRTLYVHNFDKALRAVKGSQQHTSHNSTCQTREQSLANLLTFCTFSKWTRIITLEPNANTPLRLARLQQKHAPQAQEGQLRFR